MSIKTNMENVLKSLAKAERDKMGDAWVAATDLQKDTGISPADINDAVELLVEQGLAKWRQSMGTAPFKFHHVMITARGRLSLQ